MEILSEKDEVNLEKQPLPNPISGNISFENVKFRYPSRTDIEVLKGLNINIASGKKIALVGPSGAGKSTIVQLLMKLYNLADGK
ncbi:MAG: ATP-binding cassette domain-containing protein [Cytophagaceae bacterium]|nr:ATP-binding cassette domain-containing protein [Cytophagaceae bacterium]